MSVRAWLVRGAASLALLAVVAGIAIALQRDGSRLDGPRPIVWGEEACAHCRMHVSEPRHAAQLLTGDGRALVFDDPGCLLLHLRSAGETPARVYFHHSAEERWLEAPAVAFTRGGTTPMGFGLFAVDPGTAGALDYTEAVREVITSRAAAAPGHEAPAPQRAAP